MKRRSVKQRARQGGDPLRLLWLSQVAVPGGGERSLCDLALRLADDAAIVAAMAAPVGWLSSEVARSQKMACFPITAVRLRRPGWRRPLPLAGWWQLRQARRQLQTIAGEFAPDIIHANSLTALLVATALPATALIWHVRDLKLPPRLTRLLARRSNAMIAISRCVAERLQAVLPPELHDRIHLVYNGIDLPERERLPQQEAARKLFDLPPGVPLIGMMANLVPWKGHRDLLRVAGRMIEKHPQLHFVMAGGDLLGENRAYQRELQGAVRSVKFAGRVHLLPATEEPLALMSAFDLLLHPAAGEPFGRVVCEAMSLGIPVVACDDAGPAEIIADRESGLLVKPGDHVAMQAALERLLGDPAESRRLALAAVQRAGQFSAERCVMGVREVYRRVGCKVQHCKSGGKS